MTAHNVRIVASSPGRYFVADEDNEVIAESAHPLNAAARVLLMRHFARESDVLCAYFQDQFIAAGEIGWLAGGYERTNLAVRIASAQSPRRCS